MTLLYPNGLPKPCKFLETLILDRNDAQNFGIFTEFGMAFHTHVSISFFFHLTNVS